MCKVAYGIKCKCVSNVRLYIFVRSFEKKREREKRKNIRTSGERMSTSFSKSLLWNREKKLGIKRAPSLKRS